MDITVIKSVIIHMDLESQELRRLAEVFANYTSRMPDPKDDLDVEINKRLQDAVEATYDSRA